MGALGGVFLCPAIFFLTFLQALLHSGSWHSLTANLNVSPNKNRTFRPERRDAFVRLEADLVGMSRREGLPGGARDLAKYQRRNCLRLVRRKIRTSNPPKPEC